MFMINIRYRAGISRDIVDAALSRGISMVVGDLLAKNAPGTL